jgi:hypothetical protein
VITTATIIILLFAAATNVFTIVIGIRTLRRSAPRRYTVTMTVPISRPAPRRSPAEVDALLAASEWSDG